MNRINQIFIFLRLAFYIPKLDQESVLGIGMETEGNTLLLLGGKEKRAWKVGYMNICLYLRALGEMINELC